MNQETDEEYLRSNTDLDAKYRKTEHYSRQSTDELAVNYKSILSILGEDPNRGGLIDTPVRVARAMQFMTQGYEMDPNKIVQSALFDESCSEMVLVKDIELYSMCEHHMLPFIGKAHIAYIPDGKIVGLSKIARVVDVFARRLQVQERLTHQILKCLTETLKPQGVAIVIEARHLCMMMRGIQKQNSITTTSAFTGEFEKMQTRSEFISLISANLL